VKDIIDLSSYQNENELSNIIDRIGDRIRAKEYSAEEVMTLIEHILKLDILTLSYPTRENILNSICEAVSNYKVNSRIDWGDLKRIRAFLENDLKEYVDEFL
jgi:hypothetical protein